MEHMLLKVAPAALTDLGEFEAVISTETVDREKDIVSADAMVAALQKWNRPVPLSWNHSTKPEDIFGHVDPQSARNVNGEVVINGKADLESTVGIEAWRSFKNGTVGFSFGYLIPDGGSTPRDGGGKNITELDIFEVTATPTPMNNDTRVLSTKGETPLDLEQELREVKAEIAELRNSLEDLKTQKAEAASKGADPLKQKADALVLEMMSDGESLRTPPPPSEPAPRVSPADVRRQMHQATLDALIGGLDPNEQV